MDKALIFNKLNRGGVILLLLLIIMTLLTVSACHPDEPQPAQTLDINVQIVDTAWVIVDKTF